MKTILPLGLLVVSLGWGQAQPNAERTKEELSSLLDHYPPAVKRVLSLDSSLLANQPYLATYPGLTPFLRSHPEVEHNPSFYLGEAYGDHPRGAQVWEEVLAGMAALTGFGMAIGLVTWLIRTTMDYRRWNRLAKVQTEVHTKLLDRFTANDELLEYMKSPAGAKFLESAPIALESGSRALSAPVGRMLWSVQAGVVLMVLGTGLNYARGQMPREAAQPIQLLAILSVALGIGFVLSALVSFLISSKLGLMETGTGMDRSHGA